MSYQSQLAPAYKALESIHSTSTITPETVAQIIGQAMQSATTWFVLDTLAAVAREGERLQVGERPSMESYKRGFRLCCDFIDKWSNCAFSHSDWVDMEENIAVISRESNRQFHIDLVVAGANELERLGKGKGTVFK